MSEIAVVEEFETRDIHESGAAMTGISYSKVGRIWGVMECDAMRFWNGSLGTGRPWSGTLNRQNCSRYEKPWKPNLSILS